MIGTRAHLTPSKQSLRVIHHCASQLRPGDPRLADWHETYTRVHANRLATDLDIVIATVSAGSKVLECGSVPLVFTLALAEVGYEVTGCDIAPERYADTIQELALDVSKCDLEAEQMPFRADLYDAVVFNELFEHLRINLVFTMGEVYRVLKPEGVLLLSSPNLRSLTGIFNFLFRNRAFSCSGDVYAQYRKLDELGHMGHVREYTTLEVADFLSKVGFCSLDLIFRGSYNSAFARGMTWALPQLRPFVSYVARKPDCVTGKGTNRSID